MLIPSSTSGRLGNQLILHAHILAFALENRVSAYFPRLREYRGRFEGTRDSLVVGSAPPPLVRLVPDRIAEFLLLKAGNFVANQKIRTRCVASRTAIPGPLGEFHAMDTPDFLAAARRHRLLLLLGFRFRAYDSFARQQEAVRRYFTPVAGIRRRVMETVQAARARGQVLVGVHVRQGDYAGFLEGRYHHSLQLYREKLDGIGRLFHPKPVVFLVAAERPVDPLPMRGLVWVPGPGTAMEDMYALAQCDYLFGVPSTFSRWAAFYGKVPHWIMREATEEPRLERFQVEATPLGYPPSLADCDPARLFLRGAATAPPRHPNPNNPHER